MTGVDDEIVDGTQVYELVATSVSSADPDYDGFVLSAVELRNVDDD